MLPIATVVDHKNAHTAASARVLCASFFHLHHAVPSLVPERGYASPPYMTPIFSGSSQSVQIREKPLHNVLF